MENNNIEEIINLNGSNLDDDNMISFHKETDDFKESSKYVTGEYKDDIYNRVNTFFKNASPKSINKIMINKKFLKIHSFFKEALYYFNINYLHMVNQVESALLEIEELWKLRDKVNNKYNLYSHFINLLQTQINCILVEDITKNQLEFLESTFKDLVLDKLNLELLKDLTSKLSKHDFPLFKDLI